MKIITEYYSERQKLGPLCFAYLVQLPLFPIQLNYGWLRALGALQVRSCSVQPQVELICLVARLDRQLDSPF